jgi:hypothetical protein
VGYSRGREAREIVEVIDASNSLIDGITLGAACAANFTRIEVASHVFPVADGTV